MSQFAYDLPIGAQIVGAGRTRFKLWAPSQSQVSVEIEGLGSSPLQRDSDGFFVGEVDCPAGASYRYRISDELSVPDPAARLQAHDVHDASVVVDPTDYNWEHPQWLGRPWSEIVIYELHVGCCGGFAGVEARLVQLAKLGITAIELMPIADFSGARNWGYDGVLPYAPDTSYGTPNQLKRLIDSAHALGICVYLDVVYNHFGPDGNFLHAFAPQFFDETKSSPWGAAIDFSRRQVRDFFSHNALFWLLEYRFDGLRFDAVHAIEDPTWLAEMAACVRTRTEPERHVHLMLENEHNEAQHLDGDFNAQWNDDIHNVLHVLLTGEHEGYYANYVDHPVAQLARGLAEGFIYQGQASPSHAGANRGTPSGHLPANSFIFFLQNHDQIGNRAFGERLTALAAPAALRAATLLQLLCPQTPLLFMGEEWGSTTPFLFFTDFHAQLADAVREGRRREFAKFSAFADAKVRAQIPDPNALSTFTASQPDFTAATSGASQEHWLWVAELLRLRQLHVAPALAGTVSLEALVCGDAAIVASWQLGNGATLRIATNLALSPVTVVPLVGDLLSESLTGAGVAAEQGTLMGHSTAVFLQSAAQLPQVGLPV